MIFFIDGAIGMGNSGIEHAEFYRAKRFEQAGLPYKYIYTDLVKELREAMAQWKLKNESVANLWEYFVFGEEYLHNGIKQEYDASTNLLIDSTNTHRMRDTYTKSGMHIVEHYVKYPNKHKNDNMLLVSTGRVEIFNTATRERKVMFEYVDDIHRNMIIRNIHLYDQNGEHLFFPNEVPLHRYFFQHLDRVFPGQNIFFIDRGEDAEDSLFNHALPDAKIIEAIHADHLGDRNDPRYPLWNNYYEYLLTHLDRVDKVVVATELQRQDLLKDFPDLGDKFVTIPVGGVSDEPPAMRHDKHTPLRLVTASRLAAEKHIDLIIRAVAKLNAVGVPTTLTVFGQGETHDKLKKTIEETKSQDTVTLAGLSNQLNVEYPKYDVFVSASYSEGFGLTYIEALNAALPVVTFNARFGAQELIKDGYNGFLQDFKREDEDYNVNQLVAGVKRLLADDYDTLQEHTRESVKNYQNHVIAGKWRALIDELRADK